MTDAARWAQRLSFAAPVLFLAAVALGVEGFPPLREGEFYVGEVTDNGPAVRVELALESRHVFALRRTGGGLPDIEAAGNWRQIRGGTLLQLSNDEGLRRELNVGGGGDLYFDVLLPDRTSLTVALAKQERSEPVCRPIAGFLAPGESDAVNEFRDVLTGRPFALVNFGNEPKPDVFLRGRGCLSPSAGPLPVLRIENLTEKNAPRLFDGSAGDFAERVADRIWSLDGRPDGALAEFRLETDGRCMASLSGPGFRQEYACAPGAGQIALNIPADATLPATWNFWRGGPLNWRLEGDMLILLRAGHETAALERVTDKTNGAAS